MPIFEPWDIVRVPFPYIDRPVRQHRPALVVAAEGDDGTYGLLWLAMVTSAANRGWPGDVTISNLREAGLPIASIVRPAKLATTEAQDAKRLGQLPIVDRVAVARYLCDRLHSVLATADESRG